MARPLLVVRCFGGVEFSGNEPPMPREDDLGFSDAGNLLERSILPSVVRQGEYIERVAVARMVDLRRDYARHVARASAAQPSGDTCSPWPPLRSESQS
jgi:hypothetical protein